MSRSSTTATMSISTSPTAQVAYGAAAVVVVAEDHARAQALAAATPEAAAVVEPVAAVVELQVLPSVWARTAISGRVERVDRPGVAVLAVPSRPVAAGAVRLALVGLAVNTERMDRPALAVALVV